MDQLVVKCNEREIRFVLEYLVSYNVSKAARAAGYAKNSADVQGAKVMARPRVKKLITALQKRDMEKFEIERQEVLWHLWACATRDGKDFVDEHGKLLLSSQNLNDLPDRITAAVDSIKQKRRIYRTEDGEEVEEIETELRLVSKAVALEMAMRHKGLFEAERTELKVSLDFDQLYRDNSNSQVIDAVEQRLIEEAK